MVKQDFHLIFSTRPGMWEGEKETVKRDKEKIYIITVSDVQYVQEEGDDRPRYRPLRSASMRETSYSRSIRRRSPGNADPDPNICVGKKKP